MNNWVILNKNKQKQRLIGCLESQQRREPFPIETLSMVILRIFFLKTILYISIENKRHFNLKYLSQTITLCSLYFSSITII